MAIRKIEVLPSLGHHRLFRLRRRSRWESAAFSGTLCTSQRVSELSQSRVSTRLLDGSQMTRRDKGLEQCTLLRLCPCRPPPLRFCLLRNLLSRLRLPPKPCLVAHAPCVQPRDDLYHAHLPQPEDTQDAITYTQPPSPLQYPTSSDADCPPHQLITPLISRVSPLIRRASPTSSEART